MNSIRRTTKEEKATAFFPCNQKVEQENQKNGPAG
jgi:hypothetical protein